MLDVIESFADRGQRLFAERLNPAQLLDLLPHFSDLIVGERIDELMQLFSGSHIASALSYRLVLPAARGPSTVNSHKPEG